MRLSFRIAVFFPPLRLQADTVRPEYRLSWYTHKQTTGTGMLPHRHLKASMPKFSVRTVMRRLTALSDTGLPLPGFRLFPNIPGCIFRHRAVKNRKPDLSFVHGPTLRSEQFLSVKMRYRAPSALYGTESRTMHSHTMKPVHWSRLPARRKPVKPSGSPGPRTTLLHVMPT